MDGHDYTWDYRADPAISVLTEARWDLLAEAHREIVLTRAPAEPTLVSIGGGGENRSGRRLDGRIGAAVVIDPSWAQLREQQFPAGARSIALRAVAEHLPLATGAAHVVELQGTIDHVDDVALALAEAGRILAPGGLVTVTVTNDGAWYKRAAARFGVVRDDGHVHAHHFDVASLATALRSAGFVDVRSRTIAYLRLPVPVERRLGALLGEGGRRSYLRGSDAAFRSVLGPDAGGMTLISAVRPPA